MENNKPKGQQEVDKEFGLTTFSLKNKTTVFVLTALVVFFGISSYITLPKENFPEVEIPTIYVGTFHAGNSPVDMENLITRPIEKEINTISSVDKIKSTSVQDYSTIIIEFNTDIEVSEALTKVKDAVDKAKSELPSDLKSDPNVFELNFSEFPVLNINLSGDFSVEKLNEYAEWLEDEIEKYTEVSKVEIRGVDEKEVQIWVDPHKMEARMISFSDIENAIASENITLSGGNVLTNGVRRSVRVVGEFEKPAQLENIIIKDDPGIVYLKDIATIEFDYKEKEDYARLGGSQVVMVDVIKRSGENLLDLTDKIYALLDEAKESKFPENLEITITNDQSKQTRDQVSNLENSIISGIILVVLVLLFFLGTRNSLFVGMAIPLSMFTAFMILGAFGITINMMVLFSLIMALGMLVDNGIVVVENVYRQMERGLSPWEATRLGVGEVAMPIISSTATTLAAFVPLAFWPGMMGEFMKFLPITLIITLGSSLFVALVINPVFIATYMQVGDDGKIKNAGKKTRNSAIYGTIGLVLALVFFFVGNLFLDPTLKGVLVTLSNLFFLWHLIRILNMQLLTPAADKFQTSFLPWLEGIYFRVLSFALAGSRPRFVLLSTFGMLVLSIVFLGVFQPNVLFFPENDPKYVNVFIDFPVGTDIEVTNDFTSEIYQKVSNTVKPYDEIVESIITNVGQGVADPNDPSAVGQGGNPNKARITVNFVEFQFRNGIDTREVMNKIRSAVSGYAGVAITVDKDAVGPPAGKPVNIEISGEDYQVLVDLAEELKVFIQESGVEGIERLKTDLETGKPELVLDIDREKARRYGLSTYSIASEIRTALFGKEISKYKLGEDDYEINLRLADEYRYDVDALMSKRVTFRDNKGKMHQVPISSLAKAEFTSTFGSVRRKDLDRVVTISSNVLDGYNATEINDELKVLLADFKKPAGYDIRFTGEQEEQAENMGFLLTALTLAVFMIFLIIVSQFNKVSAPFIIMLSVLFSTIGVFLGLVIFQMDFIIIMTMIGIISLAGIVVNNAIVLIDFIELIKGRKRKEKGEDAKLTLPEIIEAIKEAGRTRLRPVLLTAITTILGLIPLAVGININFFTLLSEYDAKFYIGGDNVAFWGPMSWTIIFGLIFATFLTLVVVPVMYLITDKFKMKIGRA